MYSGKFQEGDSCNAILVVAALRLPLKQRSVWDPTSPWDGGLIHSLGKEDTRTTPFRGSQIQLHAPRGAGVTERSTPRRVPAPASEVVRFSSLFRSRLTPATSPLPCRSPWPPAACPRHAGTEFSPLPPPRCSLSGRLAAPHAPNGRRDRKITSLTKKDETGRPPP